MMLKNGTHNDTVYFGQLDASGVAEVNIPERYSGYSGMGRIVVNSQAVFEFVVNGEDFSLACEEAYPHGDNVKFTGSPENTALQTWFGQQAVRREKLGVLGEMERVYSREDPFYPLLERERRELEKEQSDFEAMLEESPLYTARFMRFRNLMDARIIPLSFADSSQMASVRNYVLDSLDMEGLYTSGVWFEVVNGLLPIYDNGTPYHPLFAEDMSHLLSRIKSPEVYTGLASDLFSICEATGWNDLEERLVYFLTDDNRLQKKPQRLQEILARMKLLRGAQAPQLTPCVLPKGKVLLAFYQSDCGLCKKEMQHLIENYPQWKKKGFKVISLSADRDLEAFKNFARTFPWKDRYCDFQSYSGPDFQNYGIISAPTFFVVEKGVILERHTSLEAMNCSLILPATSDR
jgi:thiol-disulfide isomerase/thioredoxin